MKSVNTSAIFLDTTYILPYFGIQLEKINDEEIYATLNHFEKIHISETSILEAKGKLLRLAMKNEAYLEAVLSFGDNLDILTSDPRIALHQYRGIDDHFFNRLSSFSPKLNFFDQLILAQSMSVGNLLTEDELVFTLSRSTGFRACEEFRGLNVLRFRDLNG